MVPRPRPRPVTRSVALGCLFALAFASCMGTLAPGSSNASGVGPDGGVVRFGEVTLTIPPGALDRDVVVSLSDSQVVPPGYSLLSHVYDFEPAGLVFHLPASVSFAGVTGVRPVIYWSDPSGATFVPLPTSSSPGAVSAPVGHFSLGFVAEAQAPPDAGFDAGDDGGGPSDAGLQEASPVDAGSSDAGSDGGADAGTVPFDLCPGFQGYALGVDTTTAYVVGTGTVDGAPTNALFGVALEGGTPVDLASQAGASLTSCVVAAPGVVYFSDSASIRALSLDGGTVSTIFTGQQMRNFVVDGTNAYTATLSPPAVWEAPLAGGAPPTQLATFTVGGGVVAVDANNVYYNEGGNNPLYAIPLDGGSPAAIGQLKGGVDSMLVDSTGLYVGTTQGLLLQYPLDGGGAPVTIATEPNFWSLAKDGALIYFASPGNGTVGFAPLDGGATTILSQGGEPLFIALDPSFLYWTDPTGSNDAGIRAGVLRLPR